PGCGRLADLRALSRSRPGCCPTAAPAMQIGEVKGGLAPLRVGAGDGGATARVHLEKGKGQGREISLGPNYSIQLERQLQAQLNLPGVKRSGSLAEMGVGKLVVRTASGCRQQEVGVVEHIKYLPAELQVCALSYVDALK